LRAVTNRRILAPAATPAKPYIVHQSNVGKVTNMYDFALL